MRKGDKQYLGQWLTTSFTVTVFHCDRLVRYIANLQFLNFAREIGNCVISRRISRKAD